MEAADNIEVRYGASPSDWRHFAETLRLEDDLLPYVANPHAKISAKSSLKELGKLPSRYDEKREVVGVPQWPSHVATSNDIKRWMRESDLGICVIGRRVKAIDIDIADPAAAREVREFIEVGLGQLPLRRRSNSGKCLLVVRNDDDIAKRIIKTPHGNIELLGNRQQWLCVGTHPSGSRYEWVEGDGVVGLPASIPEVSLAELDTVWQAVADKFGTEQREERRGLVPVKPRRAGDMRDPTVAWLDENGWVREYDRSGRVDITCPWEHEHTSDSGPSATSYFPAGVGGFEQGHFRCLHAHCAGRSDGDFVQALGLVADDFGVVELSAEEQAEAARAAERDPYARKVDFTDQGNANLLARLTDGRLRYVTERKQWLAWHAERWEVDAAGVRATGAAGLVAKHYATEAERLTRELKDMDPATAKRHQRTIDTVRAWEKACRNRRGIDNMLALAAKHESIVISETALDTNPYLLGVQNGVVDLRTGELRPDARDEFVTQRCAFAYRPDAPGARWRAFIDEVTGEPVEPDIDAEGNVVAGTVGRFTPRPAFADYLQRAIGYSSSAVTREQKMHVIFNDRGSNGKNVLTDTLCHVLGDYAVASSPKLLLAGRRDSETANTATPALFALKGKRFAVGSEPPAGASFEPSMLKALTGNATIKARALHQGESEIPVTFHLWLLCNARPRLQHLERSIAGRLLLLPFDRSWNRPGEAERDPALPDADPGLLEALKAEGEGVLAWVVEGAVRYFAEGLQPCPEVVTATRSYFAAQRADPVGAWLAENTEPCAPSIGATATALFESFTTWRTAREAAGAIRPGDSPVTPTAFGLALKKRDIERTKDSGRIRWGRRLRSDFDDE